MHDEILWRGVIFAFILLFGLFCMSMTLQLYDLRQQILKNREIACGLVVNTPPEVCRVGDHVVVP